MSAYLTVRNYYSQQITIVLILLIFVTLGHCRPAGVSQVGFSIYRNQEEAVQNQKNPLIVTYSISHPPSQDEPLNRADHFYNPNTDYSHQFHHHQLHQQQMESFRRSQQQQQQQLTHFSQNYHQYQPQQPRPQPQPLEQTRPEILYPGPPSSADRIVIDSIPLPHQHQQQHHPKKISYLERSMMMEGGKEKSVALNLNEALDGTYPVEYY